ncbi:hypothetical protein KUV50_01060 [Membranicola marinus]|uniref:Uncharacterized protein n=1 Tax=Membranihabitans marinus TaxID=1227546 RepID=A0A953HKG7_9BACT|nr:contractile injection system tape measure protein [Membranihabitans marinus]MBY5956704.1 hypothetical protein [Membranihabitans marinus]
MANKHLIGKQVVKVEVGASADTYVLQQRLSEMVWNRLAPKLNDLFDHFAGEDEVLRLDKVVVDLGDIDLNLINDDLVVEKILRLVEAELRQYRSRVQPNTSTQLGKQLHPQSVHSTRQYMFQLWLYWLEKGVLPSYALRPDKNWITQVLETLAMEQRAVSALRDTLMKNKQAMYRLILQHRIHELTSIVELYTGHSQKDLPGLLNEIHAYTTQDSQRLEPLKTSFRAMETGFWNMIFQEVIHKTNKKNSFTLQQLFLTSLPKNFLRNLEAFTSTERENFPHLNQLLSSEGAERENGGKLPESRDLAKDKNREKDRWEENRTSGEKEDCGEDQSMANFRIYNKTEKLGEKDGVKGIQSSEIMDEGQKYEEMESPQFLKNAGIILLHPFLHRFFRKLELVEDQQFKDYYTRSKSVYLLHFLGTGHEFIPEYELVLAKLLCGMPANLPLDHTIQLTKEEKDEANRLLEAVIINWGVLGNTSPDGLREGFVIRDGKLTRSDTGWKLTVEPQTIDILLDRLPWGISMIKLPWMQDLIKVEWR